MRRAAKRDAAEAAIVAALKSIGCEVWPLSGKALPDLLLKRGGVWQVCEVKSTQPRKQKWKNRTGPHLTDRLSRAQQDAHIEQSWPIVRNVEEAFLLFGVGVSK